MQHTETQSHAQGAGFTHLLHWWSKHTLCQSTSEQNKVNLIKQQKTHLETWQGQHDTDKWWGRSCGLTWANHGFNMGEPSFCAHIPFFGWNCSPNSPQWIKTEDLAMWLSLLKSSLRGMVSYTASATIKLCIQVSTEVQFITVSEAAGVHPTNVVPFCWKFALYPKKIQMDPLYPQNSIFNELHSTTSLL